MRSALVATCILALLGCARSAPTTIASPAASAAPASQNTFPPGIVPPATWQDQNHDGIWPSPAQGCCLLGPHAVLTLDNPKNSELAVFRVYVPAVPPYKGRGVRLSCAFEGIAAGPPQWLAEGVHNLTFEIPPALRAKSRIVATLDMSPSWNPRTLRINQDSRDLSIVLLKVGYI